MLLVNDNVFLVAVVLVLVVRGLQQNVTRLGRRVQVVVHGAFVQFGGGRRRRFRTIRVVVLLGVVCVALFEVNSIFTRLLLRCVVGERVRVDLVEPLFGQTVHVRLTISKFL